jgi:hypothetical protein
MNWLSENEFGSFLFVSVLSPREGCVGGEITVENVSLITTSVLCLSASQKSNRKVKCFHTAFVVRWDVCFRFSPNIIMDLEALARSIERQDLLAKPLLALLSGNIALLDIADPSFRRAFVQVLHQLAQRVLVALCFAGDLEVLSVVVMCGIQ